MQVMDRLSGEAAAPEANDIEACKARTVAERHGVGNDVIFDPAKSPDESMIADPHELMYGRTATHDDVIADARMARQHHVIGENNVIADLTVVRDMGMARKAQWSPTTVRIPPPSVPGFIVTPSRMRQLAPITSVEGSP